MTDDDGPADKSNTTNGSGGGLKAVTVIVTAGLVITGVMATISPMKGTIAEQAARLDRIEARTAAQMAALDAKLQIELSRAEQAGRLENERDKARLVKLESWQSWWFKTWPQGQACQDGRLTAIERILYGGAVVTTNRRGTDGERCSGNPGDIGGPCGRRLPGPVPTADI